MKEKSKKKAQLKGKKVLLVLGIIYSLITILVVISYVSKMNSISTTVVTFSAVLGAIWWQLLMIVLFAVAYILYNKKKVLGILLEIIMGMAMLVYIVITVATMGINFLALFIELIYPLILIIHGLIQFKKANKNIKTRKIKSTI